MSPLSRRERLAATVLLLILPLVAWIWIAVMARDMYGPMTGASAWMMTPVWDGPHLLLLWTMWAVMMGGMMLPTASPLVLAYASIRDAGAPAMSAGLYAIAGGYVAVWALFSVAATALQRLLSSWLLLSPMMESTRAAGGLLLVAAGAYQVTPWKRTCLHACQSPAGFLITRWRDGTAGAFLMGAQHGLSCVGCCWALMLLLFAGGVMNLSVIAALTLFVAFEKFAPVGASAAWISAAGLVTAGAWMLAR